MIKYISKLLYLLPAKKSSLVLLLLLFLFSSVIEVFGIGIIGPFIALATNPQIIRQHFWVNAVFEKSGINSESYFVALIGLFVVLTFCFKSLLSWFTQVYILRFSNKQQQLLAVKLMHHYLTAPYIVHTEKNSAQVINSVLDAVGAFAPGVLTPLLTFVANIFVATFITILLCTANSTIIIAILLIFIPLIFLFGTFKDKIKRWGKENRLARQEMIRVINHGLGGIKETRVIGCEAYFEQQLSQQAKIFSEANSNFFTFKISPRFIVETMFLGCIVGVLSLFLILDRDVSQLIPVLSIFGIAAVRMIPILSNSTGAISVLRNSSFLLNRLYNDLKELESSQALPAAKGEISNNYLQNRHPRKKESNFQKQITIDSIYFNYPNTEEQAVKDLSLTIEKGQSIALIGKSGAGKTTLVDIILGLLIPQQGDIKVDDRSIYQDLRAWRNSIGYIPQSIFLIDDTLESNIAFGVLPQKIDRQRLHQAIEAAQLTEVVERLPQGVKTVVGERGVLLSGGQRQRVGIARALYHEREILVLDEATAALDNDTEALITKAIEALGGQKTIITIAHRLSTVKHCDRVYLLDRGKIVKSGTYDRVVEDKSASIITPNSTT